MNINGLLSPLEAKHLLSSKVACAAMPAEIMLGMPHLCMHGLSETWLLKECGHRHWLMLAAAAGLDVPDFRDSTGNPIYAAFLSVSIRDAALETACEHARLVFASRLARISRTRIISSHRISISGHSIGEIVMTSTFVRRAQKGSNHAVIRIEVPALQQLELHPDAAAGGAEIAALRSGRWRRHLGFERSRANVIDRCIVDPCPRQDFNGADFLYFASYQAFVDRAEWAFFRTRMSRATTRRRDIVYCGNIDPGERLVITLLQVSQQPERLNHWYRLERELDGSTIADIFTVRALPLTGESSEA
jgi:probable biosynthetic protein (TIGR04099 family)